jgi:hypothetical protein
MAKLLVWATGIFFVLYGTVFLIAPSEMAIFVTGNSPQTASGIIDLRATYGGLSISMGVVLLILASSTENLRLALLCTAIVLLTMAGGRVLGMFLDGSPNLIMYVYLVAELVVSSAALWFYISTRNVHDG